MRLIAARRAEGATGDDLISVLLRARIGGKPLTDRELLGGIHLLLIAGNHTTREVITGGVLALLQHRDALQQLLDDPSLLDSAIEEILRWTSIVVEVMRTCIEDTEIRGQRIRAGETVALYLPSANRDEEVFTDPYRFDITREPNLHFTFGGYGEHFCLGAHLARWELRAMFRELLPLLPRMELVGPPERVAIMMTSHTTRLLVRYRRSLAAATA